MYDTKRFLVSVLVFGGIIKFLQFGVVIHHLITAYTSQLLVGALILSLYVAIHLFGLVSAVKERPCGLKAFSVQQSIFVVFHVVGLLYLLWGQIALHHSSPEALDTNQPMSLTPFQQGEDVLVPKMDQTTSTPGTTTSTSCKWGRYASVIMLVAYILTTLLDLISAILSWKGYKQLVAADAAVQTFTYLNEMNDTDMMMTPPPAVQPLNVVYVPANLYDPSQTYRQ
jgi:hypothetical protein